MFDKRVAVDRDLAEGGYVQCHACRRPLSSEDLASPDYREGVSCPRCVGTLEDERAARLEERRKQAEQGEDPVKAGECLSVLLRLSGLRRVVESESRRLLCLLFIRLGQVPARANRQQLLRHRDVGINHACAGIVV